jgi:hypothetical protein
MPHCPHKVSVNTDCDCTESQADLHFRSVAMCEFTGLKLSSCICRFLKDIIWLEKNRLFCYVCSDLSADLYISKYDGHCLQRFEVNLSSVLNRSSLQALTFLLAVLLETNPNKWWFLKLNWQWYVSRCKKLSNGKDSFYDPSFLHSVENCH